MHAEAKTEKRCALVFDFGSQGLDESARAQVAHAVIEGADSGKNQARGLEHCFGSPYEIAFGADAIEHFRNRRKIAETVVDDADHDRIKRRSRPKSLGSSTLVRSRTAIAALQTTTLAMRNVLDGSASNVAATPEMMRVMNATE